MAWTVSSDRIYSPKLVLYIDWRVWYIIRQEMYDSFLRIFQLLFSMAPSWHSKQHATHANILANGSTAFIWKLCCHWLKCLLRHHIALVTWSSICVISCLFNRYRPTTGCINGGCDHHPSLIKYLLPSSEQHSSIYYFVMLYIAHYIWCPPMCQTCKWFDESMLIYSETIFW